ncbi:MAG: PorT family protein [Bacteroidetes bacterium]|nr:PorT family protein [Bacteroidota bacterium]MCL6101625.1 PorT family protein [Bacteroidota bacterium]
MKKMMLVVLFALLFFSGNSFAQDQVSSNGKSDKPHFWFGPKIGLDLVTPTIDQNAIKQQFDSNAQFGIFFQFGRKFYLQPEFYYATHKEQYGTVETRVNSLKVPVMVGLRLINLGIISAHVMAGPQGSFFLNESNPISGMTRQSSNFDLQFGGGVDLLGLITLDVRYSANLNNSVATQIQQLNWKDAVNVTLGLKLR